MPVGHLRVGLRGRGSPRPTTSTRPSACPASGSSAASATSSWSLPTRRRSPPSSTAEPAARNLKRLAALGLEGPFGLYEAIDFTPARDRVAARARRHRGGIVVRAFLAHHQGMTLVALANVLGDEAMVKRLPRRSRGSRPPSCSCRSVCRSRCPIQVPRPAEGARGRRRRGPLTARRFRSPHTARPARPLPFERRLHGDRDEPGGGGSSLAGPGRDTLREDATRDQGGLFIYLRDVRSGAVWSATYQPDPARARGAMW